MNNHHTSYPLYEDTLESADTNLLKLPFLFYDKGTLYYFSKTAVDAFKSKKLVFVEGEEDLFVAVKNLHILHNSELLSKIINRTNIEVIGDNLIEV